MSTQPRIVGHSFDTDALAPAERLPAWASAMEHWTVSNLDPAGGFRAQVRFWEVGPLAVSAQYVSPMRFERSLQRVRSSDADQFHVAIMLEGVCTICDDTSPLDCEPGDVSVMDLTRAQRLDVTAQTSIAIQAPRYFLFERTVPVDIHGRLPRSATTQLFVSHVRALVERLPEIPAAQAPALAAITRDLLAAALADMPASARDGRDRGLRARVRDQVERQVAAAPGVVDLCEALNVSRSSLYRAFDGDGGVLAFARRCRLVALHRRLADPHERRTLEQLGFAHGFPDRSHLSGLFRREFGYSPSQLRTYAATQPLNPALPGSSQALFLEILRALA
ncbi:MAG: transcriptional regulator [Phenylobacterium sp.]|nr:transcriptional regulator [Phenylobacterium sp.]